jgi:hypothetical protein
MARHVDNEFIKEELRKGTISSTYLSAIAG